MKERYFQPAAAIEPLDYTRLRDTFMDQSGQPLPPVTDPNEVFVIIVGPWPNPNVGARQIRCSCCREFAGISAKGWAFHQQNPKRPLICPDCHEELRNLVQAEKNIDMGSTT